MVMAVTRPPSLFPPKRCRRICCDFKMNGEQCKPVVTELRSMDIWQSSSKSSWCGRRKVRQSSVLIGRFACEGTSRSGNQNRLPL